MTTSPLRKPFRVLLDSNTVAKPVTRTLLMIGAEAGGFVAGWTGYVEEEANRHLAPPKVNATQVRSTVGAEIWPAGTDADTYTLTHPKDRQVLADAAANQAWFIITEDVDDFAENDLISAKVAAVNPDLFLAHRLTADGYQDVLKIMCERRSRHPNTPPDLHASLGRQHPLLVAEFDGLFDVEPLPPANAMPATLYRGARCIICGRTLTNPTSPNLGVGPECRKQ